MKMEVMLPSPAGEFNFDSACTSPYVSAPSSPRRISNFFFSAPTSPTRISSFYNEFNAFSGEMDGGNSIPSSIPFDWEETPGTPKTVDDNDFEFDFSGQLDRTSISAADELFDGGKIKPLKPPPRLQLIKPGSDSPKGSVLRDGSSPKSSPMSPTGRSIFRDGLSPKQRKNEIDPFEAAIERTRNRKQVNEEQKPTERGRERAYNSSSSSRRQKGKTRSLSPFRVSDIFDEIEPNQQSSDSSTSTKPTQSSSSSLFSFSKKWKLKDLLLFRSASEGRKESLKKYYSSLKKNSVVEDVKNSSFRSTESSGSISRRRGPAVSAHEMHYTANRAVSEEMRKKTFLPYKHGLFGCLRFNPAVHELSKGLGSLTRG